MSVERGGDFLISTSDLLTGQATKVYWLRHQPDTKLYWLRHQPDTKLYWLPKLMKTSAQLCDYCCKRLVRQRLTDLLPC